MLHRVSFLNKNLALAKHLIGDGKLMNLGILIWKLRHFSDVTKVWNQPIFIISNGQLHVKLKTRTKDLVDEWNYWLFKLILA